jgi:predicted phosphodiesterase
MRLAALYDIHGNLRALEAVLAEVEREAPDRVLIGGDVALGPLPRETLERLARLGTRAVFLRGNCDREMAAANDTAVNSPWGRRTKWAAGRCSPTQLEFLAGLPTTVTLPIDGLGPVLFCHGSPRRDDEILTQISPDDRLRAALGHTDERIIVSGHTHVQYSREAIGRRWINPGSVGMAYETSPGARWALFGPDVSLRCTPYDASALAADVRTSGFPDPEEFVEKYVASSPDPAEVTKLFEKMAESAKS